MKNKIIYLSTFLTIVTFLAITAFSDQVKDEGNTNKDLFKFSHKLHVKDLEVNCNECHASVNETENLESIQLPKMADCAGCHDVEDDELCETCHYEEVYETYPEREKSELIFDHKFHSSFEELQCTSCHKDFDNVDYGYESISTSPEMDACFNCHNNYTIASMTCENCHISTANLLPQDHKTAGFFENHKFSAEREDQNCVICHDNNFCESCHTATVMIDETNTAQDFYTPYSPHKFLQNSKMQQITRVHDLNFRYSHGIDAKGKAEQCQTCHQLETFCSECHNSIGEGDFALGGFVPFSHTKANFTTLGVGTGGGEHAILAKRDIESCIACHDIYSGDPNCILCHVDPDGIKGTNPKTHDSGFMDSEKGDWHDDQGSVCFTCHTNTGTAGIGFCGYCHSNK